MRDKTSDKGLQQNRTHTTLSANLWYWIAIAAIFIFAIGITALLGQVREPPGSEKTNLSDKKQQDDTTTKVELQPEEPNDTTTKAEPQPEEPITNAKFQQRINEWSKEYLDFRIGSVDWWLTVITITLGLFAIIITIFGFFGLAGQVAVAKNIVQCSQIWTFLNISG